MSRRHRAEKREIIPDPKYKNEVVTKFMNSVMHDGKKSVAEAIVYGAMGLIETKTKQDPLGRSGLAGINVGHDAEITVVLDLVGARHQQISCSVSRSLSGLTALLASCSYQR